MHSPPASAGRLEAVGRPRKSFTSAPRPCCRRARAPCRGSACAGSGSSRPLPWNTREQVLRDHERPHVRVVDRRVPIEVAEASVEVRALHVRERACTSSAAPHHRRVMSSPPAAGCGARATAPRRTSAARVRVPLPNSSASLHALRRAPRGSARRSRCAWRSAAASPGPSAHSSSICEGASTKSHSVADAATGPTHRCCPPRTWCIRWPNSWKNVSTSACCISAGLVRRARGSCRPARPPGAAALHARRRAGTAPRACTCPRAGACRGRSGPSCSSPSNTS